MDSSRIAVCNSVPACSDSRRRCAAAASSPAAPQFSLETSVILAAAAFEAYLEPAAETGIKDVSVTGTETRFFNEAFVRENYAGTLDVQVLSARNLSPADVCAL